MPTTGSVSDTLVMKNALGRIRQVSDDKRSPSDRWSVAYGQQVHASVEIGDLLALPGIAERATLVCVLKLVPERAPSSISVVDVAR